MRSASAVLVALLPVGFALAGVDAITAKLPPELAAQLELHLPIYHALCAGLEEAFFTGTGAHVAQRSQIC